MKNILFLCRENSCKSQIAEGFAKKISPRGIKIYSAGVSPKAIHPKAVLAMNEIGIDISGHVSKSLDVVPLDKIDVIITLDKIFDKKNCPLFPEKAKKLHWDIEDPALFEGHEDEIMDAFRKVRVNLKLRIFDFFNKSPKTKG